MQISSESTHTLTLSGIEAKALVTAVSSVLATPELGNDRERQVWESFIRVTSDHVPGAQHTREWIAHHTPKEPQ